jgi:AcrR family transcriptional regulator
VNERSFGEGRAVRVSTQTEDGLRETRTRLRRRQVLDAAARLMARAGFEAVSMQALAAEAEVSVGLIYQYFGGKQELLLAMVTDVLDSFAARVPAAIEAAGDDPVRRIAAGFRAYCEVIDAHRHVAVLTYRESRTLSEAGREEIKRREVVTTEPLRAAISRAIEAGLIVDTDTELLAYDLVLLAHAWALKHWYFQRSMDLEGYVARQSALVLRSVLPPPRRCSYRDLLEV